MKKKTKVKSPKKVKSKPKSAKATAVQEALQITWLLKGNLKNAQLSYLRVGKLLAQVRDKKMYSELGHADIEDYSEKRLQLGRSSLYKYLQVYDWVGKFHPEWLQPKPKGFIPDLYDISDLIYIEQELARKDLQQPTRIALEELKGKALAGTLTKGKLDPIRQRTHGSKDGLKAFLSKLRLLRKRGAELASMPPEVISYLDSAIEVLKNDGTVKTAGLHLLDVGGLSADRRQIC